MDVLERIRRGYQAVGPGAPPALLAMFHQGEDDAPEWVVTSGSGAGRVHGPDDIVALDLFGRLPPPWEITGVEVRMWDFSEHRSRLAVGGHFRSRPRGTWEVVPIPFIHIWTVSGDQVLGVLDYFSGIEVSRRQTAASRGRSHWWRRRREVEEEAA